MSAEREPVMIIGPGIPPAGQVATVEAVPIPEPDFEVLGVRPVKHAAAPMLMVDLEVRDSSGLEIYMVALTVQLMIEPARRTYDDTTRAKLMELFGAPERWAVTTRSLVWSRLDVLVPSFTGSTTVSIPISCHYDLELAATKYLHSLPDGQAPCAMHFNGTIYYRDEHGALQMVLVPWSASIDFKLPVEVWQTTIAHYYPNTAWVGMRTQTLEALQQRKLTLGAATVDAAIVQLLALNEEPGDA
jgi:uncharacterized protein DUF6084